MSKKQYQADLNTSPKLAQPVPGDSSHGEIGKDDFSDSMKAKKKYKDVADAAQAAFESAAYAAAAAQAAVELARPDSRDPDDHDSPHDQRREASDKHEQMNVESKSKDDDIQGGSQSEESNNKNAAEHGKAMSVSSSDSNDEDIIRVNTMSFRNEVDPVKLLDKDIVFDESDIEDSTMSCEQRASSSQAGLMSEKVRRSAHAAEGSGLQSKQHLNMVKGPISVRTRQVRGH